MMSKSSSLFTEQLISELKALSNPVKAEKMKRFFKTGEGEYAANDIFWGVPVPEQRKIAKKYQQISLDELSTLVSHQVHDVRHMALCLLVYKTEKATEPQIAQIVAFYLGHLRFINNWDLVDVSCRFILGRFLEYKDRSLLYELAHSENMWKRRMSIITCLHFIKQKDFNDALRISDILLIDTEDIVQKAVGWMLREIGNVDYEQSLHS